MKKNTKVYMTPDLQKPTKSLKFLRVVLMIFKVLSMIIFVAGIIGAVVGLALAYWVFAARDTFYQGFRTLEWILVHDCGVTVATASFMFLGVAIVSGGLIPLGWFGWKLFGNSFRAKTPFTFKAAKEWLRLAIISAGVAIIEITLIGIAFLIYYSFNGNKVEFITLPWFGNIIAAVVFVIISFLVRYGAQLRQNQKKR